MGDFGRLGKNASHLPEPTLRKTMGMEAASLKRTSASESYLKMDGTGTMNFPFGKRPFFQGLCLLVLGREGSNHRSYLGKFHRDWSPVGHPLHGREYPP